MTERFRHDTHDGVRDTVQRQGAAENVRPCAEIVAPEIIAHDHDRGTARAILFRREITAAPGGRPTTERKFALIRVATTLRAVSPFELPTITFVSVAAAIPSKI